jgi:Transposase DDE domain
LTSKSPRSVFLKAYKVGQKVLPTFSHKFSKREFTQPQLFACLILKEFFKTDYRGISAMLVDMPDLCRTIKLKKVPHYTTLQKAAERIFTDETVASVFTEMTSQAIEKKLLKPVVSLAAIDGTGFDAGHRSRYFTLRTRQTNTKIKLSRYPYATIICDTKSRFALGVHASFGPWPDIRHVKKALGKIPKNIKIKDMVADAGYDAEWVHEYAKKKYGIRTIIPAKIGRVTPNLPKGKHRRKMVLRFPKKAYGQRWQLECLNSVFKKRVGSVISARSRRAQRREILIKSCAYDVLLLRHTY